MSDGLDGATTPTLAVVGTKDTAVARRAVRHLQELMPDARGCLVPDVGHQWNAERPALFTDMVRAWVEAQDIDPRLTPIRC
ncbi:MAG: alpha/beta hydrolase [Acidimicrobiia bacterium]|nr:alpha/beta hydrolase [Acidimicrobiia bacterium]